MSENKIELGSGREIYAHCGIVGVPLEGDTVLASGYDDYVVRACGDGPSELTREELVKVADRMIARWTAVRADFVAGKVPYGYRVEF